MKSLNTKIIYFISGLFMLLPAVVSCSDKNDEPTPEPPVKTVGRTVIVYMLADNSLGSLVSPYDYDMQDINEMLMAAGKGDITEGRLLVYHSSRNGKTVLKEICADKNRYTHIDTLKIYDDEEIYSQHATRMREVFADMKELAPADDYGLILWGHGSGWLQDGISQESSSKKRAYGEEHGRWMNITTLADVLEDENFSFLYMDCCYMSSVEVAYQLRNAVPYIVAYPIEVLAYGMPYDKNIKHFFKSVPDLTAAARETFDFYDQMTNPRYRFCSVSVINTAGLERLAAATKAIYERADVGIPDGYTPQKYMTGSTCYYYDFGGYINALCNDKTLKDEFDAALAETIVYESTTDRLWNTIDLKEHSGLSTYIIKSDADYTLKNYNQLAWFDDVASILL